MSSTYRFCHGKSRRLYILTLDTAYQIQRQPLPGSSNFHNYIIIFEGHCIISLTLTLPLTQRVLLSVGSHPDPRVIEILSQYLALLTNNLHNRRLAHGEA